MCVVVGGGGGGGGGVEAVEKEKQQLLTNIHIYRSIYIYNSSTLVNIGFLSSSFLSASFCLLNK